MGSQGICLECQRTVHLAEGDEPLCPVCGSRVLGPQVEKARIDRIVRNEVAFKVINEEQVDADQDQPLGVICECGDPECTAEIRVPASKYRSVRRHPQRFVVLPGHEIPDAEKVTEKTSDLYVVEKLVPVDEV
ncbi:MAG: hypothetical protein M3343_10160 [Actinomycetota bacterium]|nr:hypothetical protein [Actinomycetota bacterium]